MTPKKEAKVHSQTGRIGTSLSSISGLWQMLWLGMSGNLSFVQPLGKAQEINSQCLVRLCSVCSSTQVTGSSQSPRITLSIFKIMLFLGNINVSCVYWLTIRIRGSVLIIKVGEKMAPTTPPPPNVSNLSPHFFKHWIIVWPWQNSLCFFIRVSFD